MALSLNGKLLADGGGDGTVRLWDPVTGQPVGRPLHATGAPGDEYQVAFSPDGKLLASADADGTVRLWNLATGQPVGLPIPADAAPLGGAPDVAFSSDSNLLATGGGAGIVQLWNISLFSNPYATLCTDIGPPTGQVWDQYASGEPQPNVCA